MDFYWRQVQFFYDRDVLNRHRFLDALALDQFGDITGACDRTATSKGFEAGVLNHSIERINLELQLHDVAALGRTDHTRTDILFVFGEAADVVRISIMLDNFTRISHCALLRLRRAVPPAIPLSS